MKTQPIHNLIAPDCASACKHNAQSFKGNTRMEKLIKFSFSENVKMFYLCIDLLLMYLFT